MFQGAFGTSGMGCGLPLRRWTRVVLLLALVAAVLLVGCGKRGDPVPPGPEEEVIYPRTYPRDETTPRGGGRVVFPPPPGRRR
ncbi:hypothetical protein [Elioraea tepidiphila]|jgi:hypothetical protein|uniref:hypothetical protein n=1 Tax=Elioraea tepidiphila TaxID=457934 RepID=UPI0003774730|nr:hypothetical protein [Elioraea tepidiphila]